MNNLDDLVRDTIEKFVNDNLLFTGLDVSNKVKETLSFARHSTVSDLVREHFFSLIQPAGYDRTPIDVTLSDGSTRIALLYHPLADSWDLDAKYDAQKRAQVAARPNITPATTHAPVPASVSDNVTVTPPCALRTLPVTPTRATPAATMWSQMFNSQPSLFPRK